MSRKLQKAENSSEKSQKIMVELSETKSLFLKRSIKLILLARENNRLRLPITRMKEKISLQTPQTLQR